MSGHQFRPSPRLPAHLDGTSADPRHATAAATPPLPCLHPPTQTALDMAALASSISLVSAPARYSWAAEPSDASTLTFFDAILALWRSYQPTQGAVALPPSVDDDKPTLPAICVTNH